MFSCFASLLARELQRSRSAAPDPPPWATAQQVENLRSLFIVMLIDEGSDQVAGARHSMAGELMRRLSATPEHRPSLVADALTLMCAPLCAGSRIDLQACMDLPLRLRAVVIASKVAHPDQQIISNITFGGPVCCDPVWIEQLASSMLDGALARGSRSGAVSFVAKVTAHCLVLSVWNYGDTVSAYELDGLFRPNWRSMTEPSRTSAAMHLCSEVVRAHQGTIEATSSVVDGTQLTARIPLRSRSG